MSKPSYFLKLFARGRYVTSRSIAHSEAGSDDPQRRHNERERFAVAAVAFCLEHDPQFRCHFLDVVANLGPAAIYRVTIEPQVWGDLVLEGRQDVVVLEFKLDASLEEPQYPNSAGERATDSDYVSKIVRHYGPSGKRLRYVIIGRDVPRGTRGKLEFYSCAWLELTRRNSPETDLERDLFDCIGTMGAPILLSRHMTRKALTTEATGALEVYHLLNRAAGSIPGHADSGSDHIGLELASSGAMPRSRHDILKTIVDPPKKRSLGWIGYERREEFEQQLCLSVWFYSSEKGKNSLRERLGQRQVEARSQLVEDGSSIGLICPAENQSDHEEWIRAVLEAVMAEPR